LFEEEFLRQFVRRWFRHTVIASLFATLMLSLAFAQKTVTKDAGAGTKQEVDYDARGRIVESRTIGADGKLLVRMVYHYSTDYEVVTKTTNISYWPDGKSVR
jgi:YD repeat-containing protein